MYVNEDRYAPPKRELSRLGLYVTREYKSSGFDCLIDESCARDRPVTDRLRKDRRRVIHCCLHGKRVVSYRTHNIIVVLDMPKNLDRRYETCYYCRLVSVVTIKIVDTYDARN